MSILTRHTLAEYVEKYLKPMVGKVVFSEVHVHGTDKPTIADYRKNGGEKLVIAMRRFHMENQGWSDIAQHATIDPDGYIWPGRDLLKPPASATGFNDPDSDGIHPFMFEMIGQFDKGNERLEGAQLATATGLCAAIMKLWHRNSNMVRFHREFTTAKTCPGTGIEKPWFISLVNQAAQAPDVQVKPPEPKPPSTPPNGVRLVKGDTVIEGVVIGGTVYVPARLIVEAYGEQVSWDGPTKTVTVIE